MLVTLGCAFLLIKAYGIKGGLTALIIGEVLVAGILWFYYGKIVFFHRLTDQTRATKTIFISKVSREKAVEMIKD